MLRGFNDVVAHNHVASYGETVHEEGIVGQGHLFSVNHPSTVCGEHFAIVGVGIGTPILGIDEVGAFKGFTLVIFDLCLSYEFRGELIAMGMGYHEVIVRGVHPFGE